MKQQNFPDRKLARQLVARDNALLRIEIGEMIGNRAIKNNPEEDQAAIDSLAVISESSRRDVRTKQNLKDSAGNWICTPARQMRQRGRISR